jgi:uncharacterized protein YbbK (DUF523 family)
MEVPVSLSDIPEWHPRLLWDSLLAATAAVLEETQDQPQPRFPLKVVNVPRFDGGDLTLVVNVADVTAAQVTRIRKTFEPARLVELAAITLAAGGPACRRRA